MPMKTTAIRMKTDITGMLSELRRLTNEGMKMPGKQSTKQLIPRPIAAI